MSNKYKLAVSVDFKDTSRHSFSESLFLAKRGDLEVVIIHVNTDPSKTEADFDTRNAAAARVGKAIVAYVEKE